MAGDYARDLGQPQPSALLALRREKWLEDARLQLRRNTWPSIAHLGQHAVAGTRAAQTDGSTLGQGINGIEDQVGQGLPQCGARALDEQLAICWGVHFQVHAAANVRRRAPAGRSQLGDLPQQGSQIKRLGRLLVMHARERQ